MAPSTFLAEHNPDVGLSIERRGISSGALRLNSAIPTLANISEIYGVATALAWLRIQVDSVDVVLGANAMGELARYEFCKIVAAKHAHMNVGNLLQFFARYKAGEYIDAVAHVGGVQKMTAALRLYEKQSEEDARRLVRESECEKLHRERERWRERAISYEEYCNGAKRSKF